MTKKICNFKNPQKNSTKGAKKFLPPPNDLIPKDDLVKVTLLLNKSSIEYFKKEAKSHKACYQAMIRTLLDEYTKHYQK